MTHMPNERRTSHQLAALRTHRPDPFSPSLLLSTRPGVTKASSAWSASSASSSSSSSSSSIQPVRVPPRAERRRLSGSARLPAPVRPTPSVSTAVFKGLTDLFSQDPGEKTRQKYQERVDAINAVESSLTSLSDTELREKTVEFKQRVANGETLDDLLVETFAVVREASKRVLGLRPFDVQLIGGMILHEGQIAEMRTGEGKTLVATLPSYLNALSGKGVHVVTVNDYLARRDSEWVGQVSD